jgi:hypothetical protein
MQRRLTQLDLRLIKVNDIINSIGIDLHL